MTIVSASLIAAEYRIRYLELFDYLAGLACNHCSDVIKQRSMSILCVRINVGCLLRLYLTLIPVTSLE